MIIQSKNNQPVKTLEETKEGLFSKVSELLPRKVSGAKKTLIGKPWLTDKELEVQLQIYTDKYNDAKAGLNVFATQAKKEGITQKKFREIVIAKGDALLLSDKKAKDLIESVRQLLEDSISNMQSINEESRILHLLNIVDNELSLSSSIDDIIKIFNSNTGGQDA